MLTVAQFRQHLGKQLGFLERSCKSFDDGHADEAVRMATVVRILLHDTRRQTSLLKHLGIKEGVRLVTTVRWHSGSALFFQGMGEHVMTTYPGERSKFVPKLKLDSPPEYLPAERWWNQTVMAV